MQISQYQQTASQLLETGRADTPLALNQRGTSLEVQRPINPPGAWTHFKAALSNLPLLGQLGSLQQARAEVNAHTLAIADQQVSNRELLGGFVRDLQHRYGEHAASLSTRQLDPADGKPLTARTITTVIADAERAMRIAAAQNNITAVRLLESPLQGGNRMRGEQDMHDVCLGRGLALDGKSSWQEALGDGAAKFVTRFVQAHIQNATGQGKSELSNEQFRAAANAALDIHAELKASPGMSDDRLGAILDQASGKDSPASMRAYAREQAVGDKAEALLDRRNSESMLCKTASKAESKYGVKIPDAVLKSISGSMGEKVRMGTDQLHTQLGCADKLASLLPALDKRLEGLIEQALDKHCQALDKISNSDKLDQTQRAKLTDIGSTRRLDLEQVERYEQMAGIMGANIAAISDHLTLARLEPCIDLLNEVLTGFEEAHPAMLTAGAEVWETGSLAGGDVTMLIFQQFADLAVAGLSTDQAAEMLTQLTGENGAQLMTGLRESPDMRFAGQLPLVLTMMTDALAARAGVDRDTAQTTLKNHGVTRNGVAPQFLLRTLNTDAAPVDARGVVDGAKGSKYVSQDFRPDALLGKHGGDIHKHMLSPELKARHGLSSAMERDIGRATFHLDGAPLAREGEDDKNAVLDRFRAHFPEGENGTKLAVTLSQCMNQYGINRFTEVAQYEAFGTMVLGNSLGTTHEAWHDDDGNWWARSTLAYGPTALVGQDGQAQPLSENGLHLYSITYRIPAESIAQGKPTIELVNSETVFDF